MRTVAPIVSVWLPSYFHAVPSLDSYPVITLPVRTTLIQRGAVLAEPAVPAAVPLMLLRHWNWTPLAADTSIEANAEPGSSVLRIITSAFVHRATFRTVATRATICPSPSSG